MLPSGPGRRARAVTAPLFRIHAQVTAVDVLTDRHRAGEKRASGITGQTGGGHSSSPIGVVGLVPKREARWPCSSAVHRSAPQLPSGRSHPDPTRDLFRFGHPPSSPQGEMRPARRPALSDSRPPGTSGRRISRASRLWGAGVNHHDGPRPSLAPCRMARSSRRRPVGPRLIRRGPLQHHLRRRIPLG